MAGWPSSMRRVRELLRATKPCVKPWMSSRISFSSASGTAAAAGACVVGSVLGAGGVTVRHETRTIAVTSRYAHRRERGTSGRLLPAFSFFWLVFEWVLIICHVSSSRLIGPRIEAPYEPQARSCNRFRLSCLRRIKSVLGRRFRLTAPSVPPDNNLLTLCDIA